MREIHHFIAGKEVRSTSGRFADIYNPNTGEVQARVALGTAAELDAAVQAAKAVAPSWAATNPQRRARVMFEFKRLVEANMDELAHLLSSEHGKVIAEGTSGDLKRSVGSGTIHVTIDDAARSQDARATLARVVGSGDATSVEVGSDPTRLVVRTDDTDRAGQALSELSRAGIAVADFSLGQPSLDEVFLALTGRPAEAPASEEVPA